MSFRYINPGYPDLLDDAGAMAVEAGTAYSHTGVAFYQADDEKGIELPYCPKEVYCRFDFFFYREDTDSSSYNFNINVGMNGNQAEIQKYGDRILLYKIYNWSRYSSGIECRTSENAQKKLGIEMNRVNSAFLHIKPSSSSSESDGLMEFGINGKMLLQEKKSITFNNKTKFVLSATKKEGALSGIIVSDAPIDPREQVIRLKAGTVTTDMKDCGNGLYEASAAGQMLLQSLDLADAIEVYGANSLVTGIAMIGRPAYRTASGLTKLTQVMAEGDTLQSYESVEVRQDETGSVRTAQNVSMTLGELKGRQVGWKAEA